MFLSDTYPLEAATSIKNYCTGIFSFIVNDFVWDYRPWKDITVNISPFHNQPKSPHRSFKRTGLHRMLYRFFIFNSSMSAKISWASQGDINTEHGLRVRFVAQYVNRWLRGIERNTVSLCSAAITSSILPFFSFLSFHLSAHLLPLQPLLYNLHCYIIVLFCLINLYHVCFFSPLSLISHVPLPLPLLSLSIPLSFHLSPFLLPLG